MAKDMISQHTISDYSIGGYPISGYRAPEYDGLEDCLFSNHRDNDENGMQFCLMHKGETLIDICAGYADSAQSQPVTREHLFSVYSSGKAMAALTIAHLAEEDRLGYEQNITSLWPDFAAHGKGDLTIAQILSHQAGLSGITDPDWKPVDWYDWQKCCVQLAGQAPIFPPASMSGYHPISFGVLAGEIARRADKSMRSLGQILREEIAGPAQADVWIGLPAEHHHRCVSMRKPQKLADLGEITPATRAAFLHKGAAPGGKPHTEWLKAEFAGSNCQASAKGLARLMQPFIDGFIKDQPILSPDILQHVQQSRICGPDQVLPFTIDFAAGIMRNTHNQAYGPNPESLGHSGWGGSCVFADPKTGLHGAYVMNVQKNTLLGDLRPRRILDYIYAASSRL